MNDPTTPTPVVERPSEPPRPTKPWASLSAKERTAFRRARAEWRRSQHALTIGAMAEWICAVRRKARLTRAGLAKYIGVSRETVFRWEQGQSLPALDHRMRLKWLEEYHDRRKRQ